MKAYFLLYLSVSWACSDIKIPSLVNTMDSIRVIRNQDTIVYSSWNHPENLRLLEKTLQNQTLFCDEIHENQVDSASPHLILYMNNKFPYYVRIHQLEIIIGMQNASIDFNGYRAFYKISSDLRYVLNQL